MAQERNRRFGCVNYIQIKLYREYLQFKEFMLGQEKSELFKACYKIDIYRNLYEIMLELAGQVPEPLLEELYKEEDFLGWLYESWLKEEDSYYQELKSLGYYGCIWG